MTVREDWEKTPEGQRAEIINGELHFAPNPGLPHQQITDGLQHELVERFTLGRGGPGGWIFIREPNVQVGEDIYEPDIAGWRVERLQGVNQDQLIINVIPDWICEVLSPSTRTRDRKLKLPNYAAAGVPWAWLVSPRDRIVEVYERQTRGTFTLLLTADLEEKAEIPPFYGAELDLEWALKPW